MIELRDTISELTIPKRERIKHIVQALAGIISTIAKCEHVLIADLTAGDGCHVPGSTADTCAKVAAFLRSKGKRVTLILADKKEEFCRELRARYPDAQVECGDMVDVLRKISGPQYDGGFVLTDPYQCYTKEQIDGLAACFKNMPFVDAVFSMSGTGPKRVKDELGKARTSYIRSNFCKKHFYITAPIKGGKKVAQWQWTVMVASNTYKIRSQERIRFYPIDSPKGKEIACLLDYTEKERQELCMPTMENIFPIHSLESQLLLPMPGLMGNANLAVG
jgi:hypothetical protein